MPADIWGFCAACDGWFPYPDWFDRTVPECVCPRCAAEPTRIVNRAAAPVGWGAAAEEP